MAPGSVSFMIGICAERIERRDRRGEDRREQPEQQMPTPAMPTPLSNSWP